MMKPINHHFSTESKKWRCTLAYNEDNKCLGIAVVGPKDQFCRKTGARIAFNRTLTPDLTMGRFCYKVSGDEELKEILVKFRHAAFIDHLLNLVHHYFPNFQTRVGRQAVTNRHMIRAAG